MQTLTLSFCLSGFTSSTVPEKFANAPSMTRISSPTSKLTRGLRLDRALDDAPAQVLDLLRTHFLRALVADEAGDLRGVLDEVPGLLAHLHLDEDVAGEAGLLADALLAVAARSPGRSRSG